MKKITLDTNVLPADEIVATARGLDFDFAVISVTNREVEGTDLEVSIAKLPVIKKTGVYGESKYGQAVYGPVILEDFVVGESRLGGALLGSEQSKNAFEAALKIICKGSFPPSGKRRNLTPGHRRQLRDAMIIAAHYREKRDFFVTDDTNDYINDGRRKEFETLFCTQIMTKKEFLLYCSVLSFHTA